jgi:isoleucyl-tRNA synthetase
MSDIDNHYNHTEIEEDIKSQWEETDAYEKVKNSGDEEFLFIDGPPFTSGRMHCGTAWGKIIKDAYIRYLRMQGYNVADRPGYDTHGLPIEVKVEEEHGFSNKQDIEEYGTEQFIQECRQYAAEQKSVMDREFSDLGIWMDWENPYVTMSSDYMNKVWSAFYQMYNDGYIGREFDVLNSCPRCETTISDSELEYGYRTVEAAYIGFDIVDRSGKLVAWTTTPWTIVGNKFIAVDKNLQYSKVQTSDDTYYIEESCVDDTMKSLGIENYQVNATISGEDLIGLEYENPLSSDVKNIPDVSRTVEHADYVKTEKTGIVHSAPGFGHDDYERGTTLGFEPYSPVQANGKFSDELGDELSGLYVHTDGTKAVLSILDSTQSLLATEEFCHEYPHCPRCDTDIVFNSTKQWMVQVIDMKEGLLSVLENTNWYPHEAKTKRFKNVIKEAPNWNISRQRYWGTPLPVWQCEDCGEYTVVSSSEDLVDKSEKMESKPDDLHRSVVDDIVITCDDCNGRSYRVEDVLDVWFDSSVAMWASTDNLPHKNPDVGPADLIIEGQDQTRGWFLMQLYTGFAMDNDVPYKDVLMHGFTMLDGKPMSKSEGHVLRPPDVIEEHGRDSLRVYLLSKEQQQNDINMESDMSGVENINSKLDIIWNVYRFATMYMNADGYSVSPELATSRDERSTLDNWVLSRLEQTVTESTESFEDRCIENAVESVMDFLIQDVSRYYIKTIRDRVWSEDKTMDKTSAYDTLGTVLHVCTRLLSPFAPFISEDLYNKLPTQDTAETVHLSRWPELTGLRDTQLESQITDIRDVEKSIARCQDKIGRKQRWGIKRIYVVTSNDDIAESIKSYEELLKHKTNTRNIEVTDKFEHKTETVEADMSVFGPKFKQDSKKVASIVEGMEPDDLPTTVQTETGKHSITEEDVNTYETIPEQFESVEYPEFTVFADKQMTDEILEMGITRDIVRIAQEMRNEMGLQIEDKVSMTISTQSDVIKRAFNTHKGYIKNEVRVRSYHHDNNKYTVQTEINDESVAVSLSR